jgi:hypothetical protein
MSRSKARYVGGELVTPVPEVFVRRAAAKLGKQGVSGVEALGARVRAYVRKLGRDRAGRPANTLEINGKSRSRLALEKRAVHP